MPTIDLNVARGRYVAGNQRRVIGSYTGPASYATGGDSFLPGDIGLGNIEFVDFQPAAGGYIITYNPLTGKAMWLGPTGVEVSGLTALNAQAVRFEAVGY